MDCRALDIEEVLILKPRRFGDRRGFFEQVQHEREHAEAGIERRFVQLNWSRSERHVLRGLHYQLNNPQDKLITVIRGEIFDVAVDIRRGSPTFGKWVGAVLSEGNGEQIYVPAGFAHGFLVLSDLADIIYHCSSFYDPDDEQAIRWNDPDLGIDWPLDGVDPVVSERDAANPFLAGRDDSLLPFFAGSRSHGGVDRDDG